MLLTITTTHKPATDLGYLLHKHPGRFQSYDLSFGKSDGLFVIPLTSIATAMHTDANRILPGKLSPDGRLFSLEVSTTSDGVLSQVGVLDLNRRVLVKATIPDGATDTQWQPR